jgi:cardiolipin synthase
MPFDSIIYRRAVDICRDASEVLVVTQYCPTGKLAKVISVKSHKVYYNPPRTNDYLTNGLISFGERITGISNQYRGENYLHAKFIIATYPSGHKIALTGSHNFISYGGILGTREIALMTSDKHIIELLESFYRQHIALHQ